jgi:hypothetical protein
LLIARQVTFNYSDGIQPLLGNSAAMNQHETIKELLEVVFSAWSVPRRRIRETHVEAG